ncbi:MAG: SGNH/GDSL hydrolase family protein [Bacteroidetes bacterium]|nr:SGNH/GDSL hydrolase family protein [Bacteroidota bacterium]
MFIRKTIGYTFSLLGFLVLFSSTVSCQTNTNKQVVIHGVNVSPDNSLLQYSGRINFSNPKAPIFYWAGTAVRTKFSGTFLGVSLYDDRGDNYYNILIDGKHYVLKCGKGDSLYTVATHLKKGIHTLEVIRRTDPSSSFNQFKGLALDQGASVSLPAPAPKLKFEIYGNSITSGHGILDESRNNNGDFSTWDNYNAYGAVTARNLNADYHCTSKSGIGFIISWFPTIMPEMYNRLDPWDPKSTWDFSKWVPDIVVINLGQNDCWLIKKLSPVPGPEEIVNRYVDFVNLIRAKYPKAAIFCVLGNMDATQEGSPWPGYIQKAVKKLNVEKNDHNIYSLIFPYKNTPGHPTVSEHKMMADKLTAFIKKTLNLK